MITTRACYHCGHVDCHCVSFNNVYPYSLTPAPLLRGQALSRNKVSARAHTPAAAGSNPACANRQSVLSRAKHPTASLIPIVRGCTALLGSARCGLNAGVSTLVHAAARTLTGRQHPYPLWLLAIVLGLMLGLLSIFIGIGDFNAAHAAEPAKDSFMDSLEPLAVPRPVSAVLFLSITRSAKEDRLALWCRLAKAELAILDLMDRVSALESVNKNAPAGTEAQGEISVNQ